MSALLRGERRHPRGTVYVFVLATTSVVALMGLTGLAIVRARAATLELAGDADRARLLSRGGVELAQALMTDEDWRDDAPNDGVLARDVVMGGGTVTILAADPSDADLTDNTHDPVEITVTGVEGRARQMYAIRFEPTLDPLPALELALLSGGDLSFVSSSAVSDGIVASNGSISAASSTIIANVQAVGAITGSGYRGSKTAGAAAFAMPNVDLFDEWESIATPLGTIPNNNRFEKFLLAPGINPFGASSPNGIYVYDCAGRNIAISEGRIYGTLILRNTIASASIDNEILGEPTEAGAPILLVEGPMNFDLGTATSDEASIGVNLNPAGAPYLGVTDSDTSDSYTPGLSGLVYVSGNVLISSGTFNGPVIIGGTTMIQGTASFAADPASRNNPPQGFGTTTGMRRVPGTWRRIVE